ncbi:polymorphic toxin-type HINT domain-containing protein [Streptomyces sp. NPDC101776]|uniref:polymorphic toxin-type HINT domain-containing protein n=1 Tax=Streptomyces sp. NPDC101776 TaxID=3366146 RepID=UPI00381744B9
MTSAALPIEELELGDKVTATATATDPETGETTTETVTTTILGQGIKHLVKITVDTDGDEGDEGDETATVTATDNHPFWVPALGEWLDATDLNAGEWLQTGAGTRIQITARSQGFLEPGERVERVLLAQGGINPWAQVGFPPVGLIGVRAVAVAAGASGGVGALGGVLGALAGAMIAAVLTTRRVVLATDRGLVVLEYGRFGGVQPSKVIARLPKETAIGALSGTWAQTELAGERLWVHKKWQGDTAVPVGRLG